MSHHGPASYSTAGVVGDVCWWLGTHGWDLGGETIRVSELVRCIAHGRLIYLVCAEPRLQHIPNFLPLTATFTLVVAVRAQDALAPPRTSVQPLACVTGPV